MPHAERRRSSPPPLEGDASTGAEEAQHVCAGLDLSRFRRVIDCAVVEGGVLRSRREARRFGRGGALDQEAFVDTIE